MRLWTRLLCIPLLLVFVGGYAFAQTAALKLTTTPTLAPAFDPNLPDYTVAAGTDSTLTLDIDAAPKVLVSVDGQPFAQGKFTVRLTNVPEGASAKVRVLSLRAGTIGCGELRTYNIRRTPRDFPTWTTERPGVPQAEFYVFAPTLKTDFSAFRNYVIVADSYGVPIWWKRGDGVPVDPKLLPNNRIGWVNFGPVEEFTLDGRRTHLFGAPPQIGGDVDPHELLLLPNGNYVYIVAVWRGPVNLLPYGGPVDGNVLDNVVVEVTPAGDLVWYWSSMDHIGVEETDRTWRFLLAGSFVDPYHMNSVERIPGGYAISQRHMNAIIAIDRATGARTWKLGGTPRPESLTFVRDRFANFGGNHDARVLADGSLTIHDNGTTQGRPPRAVRYWIDLRTRTATLMEQITDPNAPGSGFTGSSRRLIGGNWVMEWGGLPHVTELTPSGALVFRMNLADSFFSYRAAPVPYGRASRLQFREGMDRQFPRP